MLQVIRAEGVILDRILESTYPVWHESLGRQAYRQFDAAQMKTARASRHQRRYALVEGTDLLASAIQSNLTAILDQRPMRVCGIGAVFTEPAYRAGGHARALVEWLLDEAAQDGAEIALLFSEMGFVPPQVTIVAARSSTEVMTVRILGSTVRRPQLSGDDVLYRR